MKPTTPGLFTLFTCRRWLFIIGFGFALTALAAPPFLKSSASSIQSQIVPRSVLFSAKQRVHKNSNVDHSRLIWGMLSPQAPSEIQTFAADCTTPQSEFNLGDIVCAKTTGIPINPIFPNRITWLDPSGLIEQSTAISVDPQTDLFQLPLSHTSDFNGITVSNRGSWRINVTRSNGSVRHSTQIRVSDPANPAAHLAVRTFVIGGNSTIDAGSNISFVVTLSNQGPNAAENVTLSDPTPLNTTLVSFTQLSGDSFACSGNTDCTLSSMPAGSVAEFQATYQVDSNVPGGTLLQNSVVATSPTTDPDDSERSATARFQVFNPTNQVTCVLECPNDITVTATDSSGAIVTFGTAEPFGDCGAVSSSPASGSLFPIGATIVTATSAMGGGSCSFTVRVVEFDPPTITCPLPDLTASVSGTETETTVSVTPPSATGNNVTVTGTRSDNRELTDPYPVGTTIINWTATDSDQRTVSCTQRVMVMSADAPTIMCPPNRSFTTSSGCDVTVSSDDIGTPEVTGTNVTVTSRRSDDLLLTDPFPAGQTIITWTAMDDAGRLASCTQTISVSTAGVDTIPPTLNVPDDVLVFTSSCSRRIDESLGVATADDNCSASVSIVRTGVPAGNIFPVGTTVITYTATDAAGNSTTGTQNVTVKEDPAVPPSITAPADLTLETDPGATACGVLVTDSALGAATADDNCPGVTVTRQGVPDGNVFPVGTTIVTYKATDASGNTASDTQTVTVTDNTPPAVTAPGAITLYTGLGATSCGLVVTDLDGILGVSTASDNCSGVLPVSRSGVPSGNVFPVGDTVITYSATDANNNTGSATQTVTVVDNTAPIISCPTNLVLEPTCPSGAVGIYIAPVGTDNCPGASTSRTAGPASGSVFPIGTTAVTYTVIDAHGNSASCTFTVTVKTAAQTVQDLMTAINAIPNLNGQQVQGLKSKLSAALDAINSGKTNVACNKLADFINQVEVYIGNGTITSAQGQPLIGSANNVRNSIGCTSLVCS